MPCRGPDPVEEEHARFRKQELERLYQFAVFLNTFIKSDDFKEKAIYYRKTASIDNLTRLLCQKITTLGCVAFDKIIDNHLRKSAVARDLLTWWEKHQELDKERKLQQEVLFHQKQQKEKALAKLTTDEKKILGLI